MVLCHYKQCCKNILDVFSQAELLSGISGPRVKNLNTHAHTQHFNVFEMLFQFTLRLKAINHLQITAFLASWLVTVCLVGSASGCIEGLHPFMFCFLVDHKERPRCLPQPVPEAPAVSRRCNRYHSRSLELLSKSRFQETKYREVFILASWSAVTFGLFCFHF